MQTFDKRTFSKRNALPALKAFAPFAKLRERSRGGVSVCQPTFNKLDKINDKYIGNLTDPDLKTMSVCRKVYIMLYIVIVYKLLMYLVIKMFYF